MAAGVPIVPALGMQRMMLGFGHRLCRPEIIRLTLQIAAYAVKTA
jgi:hypothetical protein